MCSVMLLQVYSMFFLVITKQRADVWEPYKGTRYFAQLIFNHTYDESHSIFPKSGVMFVHEHRASQAIQVEEKTAQRRSRE